MAILIAGGCVSGVVAQDLKVPGEEDILNKTLASDSPYFYPRLMERYMAGDETLTADDYHYLYYGFVYGDSYDAHAEPPGHRAMQSIFSRSTTPQGEDARALVEAGLANMAVDPFSPSNLNMMTWACELAGDTLGMRSSAARFRGVVGAITSSGTGLKRRSPWWVVRASHADDMVAMRHLKYLYWEPWGFKMEQKKNRWEFNGIPLNRRR